MALSIKGLQYFPLDVNFFENNKIAIIISDYGLEATAVVLKLFSQIYKSGYYMDWNEKIGKIFSTSFHTKYSYATIMNLVNSLVEEDIFNKKMYEEYHILTSEKIQNCYFTATVRRKKQKISNPEYLLIADMIPSSTTPKEHLNDNSVDKNPKIVCNFQQSKVDKSKVDKSKGNESINNHTHIARESEKIRALKAEWDQWKMEMLNDEDWCATLVRYSGKGILILNNAYEIMKCFDDYIILRSSENTIQTKKDYQSGLFGWWRYNNWETDLQILTGAKAAMIENKCSAPRTTQKTSKIEEAMAVAERASEMAYQLMQQNQL